jgi:predicted nuclease of predicted toxin-antitoxin system
MRISLEVFLLLKQKGFHAEYVPQGVNDETVIEIARNKNLVLITRDSDFADELRYSLILIQA